MIEIAKTKGSGSTDFQWTNPETKKIQAKTGYIKKIPGQDAFIGTGIYK
jgi:signal transduction histidine kinase